MLYLGGAYSILISLAWGVFFWLKGHELIFFFHMIGLITGVAACVLVRGDYLRTAESLLLAGFFTFFCVYCLFFDIPNSAAPRVNHQYFLVLALYAYLFFENGKQWLRIPVISLFLGAFLLFSSTNIVLDTAYAVPDDIRIVGNWIDNITVIILLSSLVHVAQRNFSQRNQLLEDLRRAIPLNQLELHYQPQVDQDGNVGGAEALLRWHHPVHGMVPPDKFIPLAEQNGLILPIGRWVLDSAINQLQVWAQNPEFSHLTLSINISAEQFEASHLVNDVRKACERFDQLSGRLKLELTESILVQNIEQVIEKMRELKALGVSISLDDFGTGYSSLSYLSRLPLDQLKIDRSFVRDMLTNESSAAIAITIASLGHSLGLQVVAEGVETQAQVDFLLEQGCETFQGFFFSRPLPINAFEEKVARNNTPAKPAQSKPLTPSDALVA